MEDTTTTKKVGRKTKYEHTAISDMFSEKMKEHPDNYSPMTCKNYNRSLRILCLVLSTTDAIELTTQLENSVDTLEKIKSSSQTESIKEAMIRSIPCIYKVLVDRELTEEKKEPYIKVTANYRNQYLRSITIKKAQERLPLYSDFMENVKGIYGTESQEYLLVSLYKDLTCRDDFSQLLLTPKYKASISTYNYMVVRQNHPVEVILNQYKTAKLYGPIKVTLSSETSARVKRYINAHNLQYGQYLFPQKTLSGFISKMLSRCGLKGSICTMRRMMVSEFYNDPTKTEDDFEELARRMGHSMNEATTIYHRANEEKNDLQEES